MTSPWWAAFGPAEAVVSCGTAKHRLRWAGGTLHAADHPDAEGELVLAALGGDTTPCLDLVRTWGQHSDDLTVLAVGPRSAGDRLTVATDLLDELAAGPRAAHVAGLVRTGHTLGRRTRLRPGPVTFSGAASVSIGGTIARRAPLRRARSGMASGWTGTRPRGWPGHENDPARAELVRLLALGGPFQWRLSGAVAHAWSEEGQHASRRGRAVPLLVAALTGRLAPAAAQWLDIDPGQVDASIHGGDGWGQIELARAPAERRLAARLPVSWLARVWAPGMAVVGGHLVASVLHAAYPAARVLALPAPGSDPVELSIWHDGRHWSIAA